jgi:hypothetical protein
MSAPGLEELAARRSGPVFTAQVAQPPQQPVATEPTKVSEEQYATMTHAERIDYARRFPQPQTDGKRP